jgi:hypothetical protein
VIILILLDCSGIGHGYDEADIFHITYSAEKNIFYDEGGYINYNIFNIMTPNEVYLFKRNKEDVVIQTKSGDIYEIYYEIE